MAIETWWNTVKKAFSGNTNKELTAVDKMLNLIKPGWVRRTAGNVFVMPRYPWPLSSLYDFAYNSDVLTAIHTALRGEIFRQGFEVIEASKTDVDVQPDSEEEVEEEEVNPMERKQIIEFLEECNENGQDIIDVCMELEDDLNILDDAYLLMIFEHSIGTGGDVVGQKLLEVSRVDPRGMSLVINGQNRPGIDDKGQELKFDIEDRGRLFVGDQEFNNVTGNKLIRAYYKHESPVGTRYYGKHEVLHLMKYRPSVRNGYSPVVTVWQKTMTLLMQDKYLLDLYTGQRPPKHMLIFNTANRESLKEAWYEMSEKVKENPHMPGILSVQPAASTKNGKIVEHIDFMRNLQELQYIEQREEFRRAIGAVYKVSPVFQNDVSTSGGLNNEGLQVTVTNRAVELGQSIYNTKLFPAIIEALGFKGWKIQLKPSEEQDEVARLERQKLALENAQKAANMGLDVMYDENSGEAVISSGKVEAMQFDPFGGKPDDDENSFGGRRGQNRVGSEPKEPEVGKAFSFPKFLDEFQEDTEKELTTLLESLKNKLTERVKVKKATVEDGKLDGLDIVADQSVDDFYIRSQAVMRGKSKSIALATLGWLITKFPGLDIRMNFDQGDEAALDFFQKSQLDRITGVSDDLRNKIKNQISIGLINGDSEVKMAKRIGEVLDASKSRLATIARTETKRVFDQVSLDRYKEAGVEMVEWITAGDNRVRSHHAEMHGRTWKADSSEIPRDLLSEPNCRCVLVPFMN